MADDRIPRDETAQRLLATVDALAHELDPARQLRPELTSSIERDLGLDSLARVELLLRIEQAFGVHLPERTLAEAETVADLLDALRRAPRASAATAVTPAAAAPAVAAAAAAAPAALAPAALAPAAAAPGAALTAAAAAAPAGAASPRVAPQPAEGAPREAATLAAVLAWHVARHAEREHIRLLGDGDEVRTLTYGGLYQAAKRIASALHAHDVAGSTVALMLPTGLDFFTCFVGAQLAGAVPVPLYPPARPSQLEDHLRRHAAILANCRARVLITAAAIKPLAWLIRPQLPALAAVLAVEDLAAGAPSAAFVRAGAADLALLQYTSGSTGNPKGVMLTHANVLANIRAWSERVALTPADVCVSWLPLYHDMGLIGTWMGSLYNACPLVLMSPLSFLARPERWLWAIHQHRGSVTAAPNFAFELLLRRADSVDLAGLDLSCWRLCANGAEPVSAQTIERFAQRFARHGFAANAMAPVYGLAECAVGLTVPPPGRGPRIERVRRQPLLAEGRAEAAGEAEDAQLIVGCGLPLPGHEIRVVDDTGRPLPERRVGRLQFRGPSATPGYFANEAETRRLFAPDGWLDSGDLAFIADGELFPVSRVKDVIIRGGHKLHPYELEEAVGRLPGARKGCVAVVGARDPQRGTERVVVIAETRLAEPEARRQLRERIAQLAVEQFGAPADEIVLAPPHSVLKTSSGKIRRAATCAAFESGRLGEAGRSPWLQVLRLAASAAVAGGRRLLQRAAAVAWGVAAWLAAAMLLLPLLALLAAPLPLARRWGAAHRLARAWLRLIGVPPQAQGLEQLPPGAAMLVANHASYLDGVVLLACLREPVAFVAKRELRRNPLLRWALGRLGTCFVERLDVARSVQDAARLTELLRGGRRLLVFPEGTFRRAAGLRPFHMGAFIAAAQARVLVWPLSLRGTRALLPDGAWLPRRTALRVRLDPPLAPAGDDWRSALALRDAARARLAEGSGEPPLGLPD